MAVASIAATSPGHARENDLRHDVGQTLYVSATANGHGNGSASAPFNSLAKVQQASRPGDTIVVLPSPLSAAPLDGGIALQPGQRLIGGGSAVLKVEAPLIPDGPATLAPAGLPSLPRIANTTTANNGDAVTLADNTQVENLVITAATRGGIYGLDVVDVSARGNDVSGFNTSGTFGFLVQPFEFPSYTAGVGTPEADSSGVQAGWAGIMVDVATVRTTVTFDGNYVHDGVCGDGIDVRGMNAGEMSAQINSNFITKLLQCSNVHAVQSISTQVTGTSRLEVTLSGNSMFQIGNAGADSEGVFVNTAESGMLIETVDRNVFITGIGGVSANGLEYISSNGNANSQVTVSNSFFQDDPGDMLEMFNFGTGSSTALILDHVTVNQTTLSAGLPVYAIPPGTNDNPGNSGECLAIVAAGANDSLTLKMKDSAFTGCENDGIELTGNAAVGNGVGDLTKIVVDVDGSSITGSQFYNLWVNAVTPLTKLRVRVQDSNLSNSVSGVSVAVDQQSTGATADTIVDLGGGGLRSEGRNCISGGALLDLEAARLNVSAEHNWWGSTSGAAAGRVVESAPGFFIDTSSPLLRAPSACGPQDTGNGKDNGNPNGQGNGR